MPNPNPMGGKSEEIVLKGKGTYMWILRPNPQYNDFRMFLYPDEISLGVIKGLKEEGMKNTLKRNDDGYYMLFKRPITKEITDKATGGKRVISFLPPVVVDPQGNPWPIDKWLGNGCDVRLQLEVYKHKTPNGNWAKAARLAGVVIDNYVPYTKESMENEQQEAIKGLVPAKKPFWA